MIFIEPENNQVFQAQFVKDIQIRKTMGMIGSGKYVWSK
jgi:hypothetical protein